jgi:2-polyprenyl-6-methoxyphenol hydroxylase-like FAD-dependent oxidoreductase
MGVSGGLVGAYVLAGEIAGHPDDLPTAFKNYDAALRPFVDEIQAQVNHGCWHLACPRAGWRSMPFSPCRAWPHRCTSPISLRDSRRRTEVARGSCPNGALLFDPLLPE